MSRVPAENVEQAKAILEAALERRPGAIAAADQIQAFRKEHDPYLKDVARQEPGAEFLDVPPNVASIGWEIAVLEAVVPRAHYVCMHFADGPPKLSQVAYVDLTTGIVSCEPCFGPGAAAVLAEYGDETPDDGRCDTCDAPETEFQAFHAQIGMWLVSGNQCARCAHAMKGGDDGA